MAHAAVISLEHTIHHLLNSSDLLVVPRYGVITACANQVKSLELVLERLDGSIKSRSRRKVNALDEQIKEAISRFEDVLESHLSNQIVKQSEEQGNKNHFFIDMEYLKHDFESLTIGLKKMEEDYIYELKNLLPVKDSENPLPEEEDDDDEEDGDPASSRIDHGTESTVVGFSNELTKMKYQLTSQHAWEFKIRVFSMMGMAGIGKTTLANEIYKDPYISEYFNHRVWVKVGIKYQIENIQQEILAQVNPEIKFYESDRENPRYWKKKIAHYFKKSLESKSYLIVLDDVWDTEVLHGLISLFPLKKNGSVILLTTRLQQVCDYINGTRMFETRLMNEKESWDLLREEVFGGEACPPQLVYAGKKIAKNCEGLPLTIVTVARFLSKGPMDPEYWNEVAEKKNSVFMDSYNEMSKVLYPSYKFLPQHLKACFLCVGLFNEKYEIPRANLINIWMAEEFLTLDLLPTAEEWSVKCLEGLLANSVLMIYKYSSFELMSGKKIKTCGLHSSFWYFCNAEARKNGFFHALNSPEDCAEDSVRGQRRLCFRNNPLFGIQRDVSDSIGDHDSAPSARSLLCYGPYHQYQVPIWFGLRLLRVLDALNIRFYEFPNEALKLVLLKYFSLTFNGDLPTSISKLRRLQYLIVRHHLNIKSCKSTSYLPMEIWDMKELKLLQVEGSDLQVPSRSDALLPNLQTLLGVSVRSCSKEVLGRMPTLNKLGIQIELGPELNEPLRWFDHISHLRELESLKCVIVNPDSKVVAPPLLVSILPWGLKRLTLSGFRYPWEHMETIASFVNLEVLKLQCYAFQGPTWEIKARSFLKVSSLIIEDTDLVQWKLRYESLPSLLNLSIKHCYKLKEIDWEHDKYFRPKIEIVDCNPLAVDCVKQIIEAASGKAKFGPQLDVLSSYMD